MKAGYSVGLEILLEVFEEAEVCDLGRVSAGFTSVDDSPLDVSLATDPSWIDTRFDEASLGVASLEGPSLGVGGGVI